MNNTTTSAVQSFQNIPIIIDDIYKTQWVLKTYLVYMNVVEMRRVVYGLEETLHLAWGPSVDHQHEGYPHRYRRHSLHRVVLPLHIHIHFACTNTQTHTLATMNLSVARN